jgi:hypothetical protein
MDEVCQPVCYGRVDDAATPMRDESPQATPPSRRLYVSLQLDSRPDDDEHYYYYTPHVPYQRWWWDRKEVCKWRFGHFKVNDFLGSGPWRHCSESQSSQNGLLNRSDPFRPCSHTTTFSSAVVDDDDDENLRL